MSATVQGSTLLDGLKKKMRQTKEEMEKYKDECEEFQKRLQLESRRREEVSQGRIILLLLCFQFNIHRPVDNVQILGGGAKCDIIIMWSRGRLCHECRANMHTNTRK